MICYKSDYTSFLRQCQRKVLLKRKVKPEEGKSQKRGCPLYFSWMLLGKKLSNHWWCGGVKNCVALTILRVYPDPMAITSPIRKHGWLQKLWYQFWAKLIDRWKLPKGKLYFLWITHRPFWRFKRAILQHQSRVFAKKHDFQAPTVRCRDHQKF